MSSIADVANGPPLDAAIIGGGINGAAIARELAARGQRVALFEQDDFGFGTTWRSTKLIHGGLRYLEHGDVRLVFESLRERKWLLERRPHLVRPLRFLLPQLPWTRRPGWQVDLGLTAYDALAAGGGLPRHRRVDGRRASELSPGIRENGGGFTFVDARVLSPERLALELALEARELGAAVFNHAKVSAIETTGNAVSGLMVWAAGQQWRIATGRVINAAGPWVDAVADLVEPGGGPWLSATRGTHVVLEPEARTTRSGVISTARSDGRVFFAIPKGRLLLIGTTDERFEGHAGTVVPTRHEVEYLLAEAQELFPTAGLSARQVRYAYSGLRPLMRAAGGPEAAITRRHQVIDHARTNGPAGLFSVVGGKLSTFRPLARETADAVGARAGPERGTGRARPVPAEQTSRGLRMYGEAAADVQALGDDLVCEHAGILHGQIVHAVRNEMATTLSDVILRRTGMGWAATRGLCCAERVAGIVARELRWNAADIDANLRIYRAMVRQHLPAWEELRQP